MRNEYTDYIAHGHKYFAVVDLGKKNSKGTKLRRYFYSANEYKAYLQGKKTTDDKLLGGVSKAYNKVKGISTVAKTLPKLAKAVKETNKMPEGERIEKNVQTRAKRAGLAVSTNATYAREERLDRQYNEAHDKQGNRYLISRSDRKIYAHDGKPYGNGAQVMKDADEGKGRDESSRLIREENRTKKEESKKPEPKAAKKGTALGNAIRENFVERMVEKGINKANAEKLRDTIKSTIGNATSIATSASNIKNRMDVIQDALLSGDAKTINNEMDRMLDDSDSLLDDMENVAKNLPIIGTFVKAMEEDEAKWEKEKAERNAKLEKERAEREAEWNKKSAEHDAEMAKKQAEFEEAKKKIAEATDKIMSNRNDVSVLVDSAKKTLDTATAGPKAIVGDKDVKTFENSSTTWDDASMKKIEDAVNKAFEEEKKKRKK